MSEKDRKREAAMRLFGALSGVDEEYLAGCEADAGAGAVGQKPVPFERLGGLVRRYGTAVAAVLCVAVLGVSLAGYRLGGRKTAGSTQNGSMALQQENMAGVAIDQEYEAEERPEAAPEEADSTVKADSAAPNDDITDSLTSEEIAQNDLQQKNLETSEETSLHSEAIRDLENREVMTLEQARQVSVVGGYLPESFPEGGAIDVLDVTETEGQERITLGWNTNREAESESWFYLVIKNLGNSLPDWLEYSTVLEEEQFTRGNVEECMAEDTARGAESGTSDGTLSVLYEKQGNYVLLTIWGEISAEEVWEMLDSAKK